MIVTNYFGWRGDSTLNGIIMVSGRMVVRASTITEGDIISALDDDVSLFAGDLIRCDQLGDAHNSFWVVYKRPDGYLYLMPLDINRVGADITKVLLEDVQERVYTANQLDNLIEGLVML